MSKFSDLGLSGWILKQLEASGVRAPTPIQRECIPAVLAGRDCLGVARTGSGKTLAFALPILQDLSADPYGIFAVVLAPTRELASQVADQFRLVGKSALGLRECLVVGGTDMVSQAKALSSRPHVVVATPGRLADHLSGGQPTFSLRRVKYLVLDEADRMLDGSFDEQLSKVLSALPAKRRTLLFTATVSDDLRKLKESAMTDPFVFDATAATDSSSADVDGETSVLTVSGLDQRYVLTPPYARDGYMVHILQLFREKKERGLAIVFVRTIDECQALGMTLSELGFPNACLHSDKTTRERQAALAAFRSGHVRTMVATDVASRGLDVPAVDLVVNHNVPRVTKTYVHRVGRTARAGRAGRAVTLVTPHDVKLLKAVEDLIGTRLEEMEVKDEDVNEILTQVNVTRREQEIKLKEQDFEERRAVNRRKKLIKKGVDPDEEERRIARERRKRIKQAVRERKKRQKREEEEAEQMSK